MQITATTSDIKVFKEAPGLFTCLFEHEIKSTKAKFSYTGPKISPEVWHEILSFFRWTQETTHSEAQVRLYVAASGWQAWAFPQKARTGMSSEELPDNPDTAKQRAQFADMLYFGTVHHHCSCSAFQSGTDKNNESDQDGLHITVGYVDKNRMDLHLRAYIKGCEFDPDMSLFWDIGDVALATPAETHDSIARYQMAAFTEVKFPDQWKENFIELKTTLPIVDHSKSSSSYYQRDWKKDWPDNSTTVKSHFDRVSDAISDLMTDDELLQAGVELETLRESIELMPVIYEKILDACIDNDIALSSLLEEIAFRMRRQFQLGDGSNSKKDNKPGAGEDPEMDPYAY